MNKTIIIDGTKRKVSDADVIASGGEGSVLKVDNFAVKLYHNPSPNRIQKLQDFLTSNLKLPSTICAPMSLVYNSSNNIAGFKMQLLTGQNEVVQKFSSKSHRKAHPNLTTKFITELMLSGYDSISQCHNQKVIIGDNNDLNVLYNNKELIFIDADGFQFHNHPCMVGTEEFLHPELYNLNLAQQPYYKPEHDWYSWFCMFIRSILMVHPYGGTHDKYQTLPNRAIDKITVFDNGVKYPKVGLSPNLLNEPLLKLFDLFFKQHKKIIPPKEIFIEYKDSLVTCSCGNDFPSTRKSCPICSIVNTQQNKVVKIIQKINKTVKSQSILKTPGEFIWHKLFYNKIFAITIENGKYIFYSKNPDQRQELFSYDGSKFDVFNDQYLVINKNKNLSILDIKNKFQTILQKSVSYFNNESVFSCNNDSLFRIDRQHLIQTNFDNLAKSLLDKNIRDVIENQTWAQSASNSSIVLTLQRAFNLYSIYTVNTNPIEFHNFNVHLEPNESIIDKHCYFSGSTILFLVKTEIQGKTHIRLYTIKKETMFETKIAALSSDYRILTGKAFVNSNGKLIVFHPTDDGIVQEIMGISKTVISDSEPFVSETDSLEIYDKGILVVSNNEIRYLTM